MDRSCVVVVLIGLPGAGKSRVARALEQELGLHRICRDSIRAAMFPRCEFSPAEKRAANQAAMRALEVNCAMRRSSVLDGRTFARQRERLEVEDKLRGWGAQSIAVWLDCPLDLARARVMADPLHLAGDRTVELVDAVASRFEAPAAGCLQIDARQPEAEMVADAVRAIRDVLVFGDALVGASTP